jgi:hypothetical protein
LASPTDVELAFDQSRVSGSQRSEQVSLNYPSTVTMASVRPHLPPHHLPLASGQRLPVGLNTPALLVKWRRI